ncbi:MAG TPA: hypothetical protein VFD70_02965 [Anaerolineae bacterium]|nr:hypothetical protein [Anaerolineae bacterium]
MQYHETDYSVDTDTTPWTATPAPIVTTPRSGQLVATPTNTPVVNVSEMLALSSLIQSVQQTQMQQMYVLRDMNSRLARLEDEVHTAAQTPAPVIVPTYERATWWAIWGLLMLILGGALALVTVLILLNVQFR